MKSEKLTKCSFPTTKLS